MVDFGVDRLFLDGDETWPDLNSTHWRVDGKERSDSAPKSHCTSTETPTYSCVDAMISSSMRPSTRVLI